MKVHFRQIPKGLLISTSAGFSLGVVLWLTGVDNLAPLWLPIGIGLFYGHLRWLKKVNQSKSDVKIKAIP
jgi:hypothetical protein